MGKDQTPEDIEAQGFAGAVPEPDEDLTVAGVTASLSEEEKKAVVTAPLSVEPEPPAKPEKVEKSVK